MAIFRKVHTSFWSDSFTGELDTEKKLFYLYLITNEKTSACGIYEIRKKQISFDLGYSIDRVSKLLEYFIKAGKIMYNNETSEIALKNWYKYNPPASPKIQSCINKELTLIKDTVLIQYVNGIYTQSLKDKDQDKDEDKEKDKNKKQEYDFVSDDFKKILIDWLDYKKARKESYKSEKSVEAFYNNLKNLSGGNPTRAAEIIQQSMANNWAGIFELKNKPTSTKLDPNGDFKH